MKRLLFFLILALSAHGQILSGILMGSSTPAGAFTQVQEVSGRKVDGLALNCPSSCNLTVASTGAGHVLILHTANAAYGTLTAPTTGCSVAWVVRRDDTAAPWGNAALATCESSTAGVTTITFGGMGGDTFAMFRELAWSGASAGYDSANGGYDATVATSHTTPTVTLSGTKDFVSVMCIGNGVGSSFAAPFTGNISNNVAAWAYSPNTTTDTNATCNLGAGAGALMNAVAVKGS